LPGLRSSNDALELAVYLIMPGNDSHSPNEREHFSLSITERGGVRDAAVLRASWCFLHHLSAGSCAGHRLALGSGRYGQQGLLLAFDA